jgi:hypothetical protein
MAGGYGLGGAGLVGMGVRQKEGAMNALNQAAEGENRRNMAGKEAEATRKAGNTQLGSTLGAMGGMALGAQYGSVGGPMGMMIGSVVGALAGSLF